MCAGPVWVEKTVAIFGRLDVLVNNAGTAIPKPFEDATLEEMNRVIDINIRGVFVATQAALKHMKSGARVIMIGSRRNTKSSQGRCSMANVVKKYSISYELAQKMANAAVAKARELGYRERSDSR